MNDLTDYYDKLQALEKEYRSTAFSQNPEFIKKREQLQWDSQASELVKFETIEAVEYVHHTAFNAGYREGFALAKKQGENALHAATELLKRSEGRVEMLEGRYAHFDAAGTSAASD